MLLDIFEDHLDEALFLFQRSQLAFEMLDLVQKDLDELRQRLRAHLDGLLLDPAAAWQLCHPQLAEGDSEHAFVAGIVAFEGCEAERVSVVEAMLAAASPEQLSGFAAAAAQTNWGGAEAWLRTLLGSPHANARALALQALGERGVDPGPALDRALASGDRLELLAALRAAFDLGAGRTATAVTRIAHGDDAEVVARALRVMARTAAPGTRERCLELLDAGHAAAGAAAEVLGASGHAQDSARLVDLIARTDGELRRSAIIALGLLGDLDAVPALSTYLENAETAGVATAALSWMFGSCWDATVPEYVDDEDWGPDHDLPCVPREVFEQWWAEHCGDYEPGMRVCAGGGLPVPLLWVSKA